MDKTKLDGFLDALPSHSYAIGDEPEIKQQDEESIEEIFYELGVEITSQGSLEDYFYAVEKVIGKEDLAQKELVYSKMLDLLPYYKDYDLYQLINIFLSKFILEDGNGGRSLNPLYSEVRASAMLKLLKDKPEQLSDFYEVCDVRDLESSLLSSLRPDRGVLASHCLKYDLSDSLLVMDRVGECIEHSRHESFGTINKFSAIQQMHERSKSLDMTLALTSLYGYSFLTKDEVLLLTNEDPVLWLKSLDEKYEHALVVLIRRFIEVGALDFDPITYMASCPNYQKVLILSGMS